MKTFKDKADRNWTIGINLAAAKRLRDTLNVDLLQPEIGDPPLLTRLGTDEILLGEVLCVLLADQFDAHKVSADDVMAAFDGQTLLAAQEAFYEDLVDFFRGRGRTDRAKAVARQAEMIATMVALAEKKIDEIDIDEVIDGAYGKKSGDSPAPSE
jgi:hypothetical protein